MAVGQWSPQGFPRLRAVSLQSAFSQKGSMKGPSPRPLKLRARTLSGQWALQEPSSFTKENKAQKGQGFVFERSFLAELKGEEGAHGPLREERGSFWSA